MNVERRLILLVGIALLGGCATYQPHPIDAAAVARQWQARHLDDPTVAAPIRQALPPRDADQWPPAQYGRAELLAAALVLNPDLAEARAQMGQAVAAVTTAKALPNPNVGLMLERYTRNQQGGTGSEGNAPWLWGISTDWLVDAGLRRKLREELAQSGVRAARLDYAEKIWTVRQALRTALADLLLGRQELAIAQQTVQAATTLEQALQQRHAAGEASASEPLQAALTLAQARRAENAATQRIADAEARLARALGVPANALDGLAYRWDAFEHPAAPAPELWSHAVDQALLSRPDLERVMVDYDSRETELHQQIRAQYPQISLGPGYTYDHGVRKVSLSIGTTLPIFDQNQGPIAEAKAQREAAGRHVEAVQATVQKEIDLSATQFASANRALSAARAERAASARLYQQVQAGWRLGAEDRIALLQAQFADLVAAQTELTALEQSQQALGAMEDALHTPLDGAEIAMPVYAAGATP